MLAGEDGIGQISFDSPLVARATGTVALLIILFAGGLDTQWSSVRTVLVPGLALSDCWCADHCAFIGGLCMVRTWDLFHVRPG